MGLFGKQAEKIGKRSPVNSRVFQAGDSRFADPSDNLANNHAQFVEFYHLPSDYFVSFKAFITDFSDAFQSKWKKTEVYGRMDDIATFVKTSRVISFGLQTVAANVQEAEQNMTRISLLLQMLYPSFENESLMGAPTSAHGSRWKEGQATIKGSPLFKIKFLNWIKGSSPSSLKAEQGTAQGDYEAKTSGLLGYLDGCKFDPDLEAGVFQAGLDVYPKIVDLTFVFNVIHEHPLGWKASPDSEYKGVPQTKTFPYGRNSEYDLSKHDSKMEHKQYLRLKKLQVAQNKLMTG